MPTVPLPLAPLSADSISLKFKIHKTIRSGWKHPSPIRCRCYFHFHWRRVYLIFMPFCRFVRLCSTGFGTKLLFLIKRQQSRRAFDEVRLYLFIKSPVESTDLEKNQDKPLLDVVSLVPNACCRLPALFVAVGTFWNNNHGGGLASGSKSI